MSQKFKLIQDKGDDTASASIRRHLSVAAWLVIAPLLALLVLSLFFTWASARQRTARDNELRQAVMTQQALPRNIAPSLILAAYHTKVSNNTTFYHGPGLRYEVIGEAKVGQPITVIGRDATGRWYKIAGGAWIEARFVQGNQNLWCQAGRRLHVPALG